MKARTIIFICFLILTFSATLAAQRLKPKEIIYSRLPADPNLPANGANQPTIWAVGQDGSNDRFITYGTKPRISDDGRFLLFNRFTRSSGQYNPFGGYADVIVRDLSTGQETMIFELNFDTNVGGHAFSPESNQGAYEIIADNSSFMYKFNRDGTNLFRFPWENANYVNDDFPAVRRGDQLIAFSNNIPPADVGGLYTVQISGAARQRIPNTSCRDFHPAWSNDNQYIAFGSIALQCFNGNYPNITLYPYWIANILKIKPDGTGRVQISNFPANPDCSQNTANCLTLGYVWTEDNSKIIAAGRINGTKGLFAFNADGSGAFTQIPISAGTAPEYVGGIVQTRVDRNVLSIGGGVTASSQYKLVSTIGEPVAGQTSVGGTFDLASGFWAIPAARKSRFDFDGDNKTDLGIFRPSDGSWWYSRSSDNQFRVFNFGTGSDLITPGDFTGDGKADLAVFRPASGFWFIQRSEDNSYFSFPFGASGDLPVPADFDGDGKTDAAVFRPSSQTWFILRSSDGGTTIQGFGLAQDKPVAADYTGDGKADIAIYRPSSGQWWYQDSNSGQVIAFQFGNSTDRPVQGDFTGDGKADASFFRPSTGEWFILRSEDSSYFSVQFGTSGDLPVAGDYDGDGKTDVAIFRPSTNTWWINRSAQGLFVIGFGIAGDQPLASNVF